MKSKALYIMLAAGLGAALVFYLLSHRAPAGDLQYFRSYDLYTHKGIQPLPKDSLSYPHVILRDSAALRMLTIRTDSAHSWHEIYRITDSCVYSESRAYMDHDSSFHAYRFILRDSIITYLYKGDSSSHADEDHYIISICIETPKRKVEHHFYPFIYTLHPVPGNVTSSLPADVVDDKVETDYRIEDGILKADRTDHYYADSSVEQRYILYDLRLCSVFYLNYIARDMQIR